MTKYIEVWSKGEVVDLAAVDDVDYSSLKRHKWNLVLNPQGVKYATRSLYLDGVGVHIQMHRVIMSAVVGRAICWPYDYVDHRDFDGLNNRRINLRLATASQNGSNQRTGKNNKTGYKGVDIWKGKYRSRIAANNKTVRLGLYLTAVEAARAYDTAAKRLHGQFAFLNFKEVDV